MFAEKVLGITLMLVLCSRGARGDCTRGHYPSNGECVRCPDNCETCTSVNSCDICVWNSYGTTCQRTCKQTCKHANCDKVYGHCPEGCSHGEFPNLATKECNKCPASCEICSSPTKCIKCKPGHFQVYGECHECVDGCARCDNASTCTSCKNTYIGPYDGRCALNCKEANKTWIVTKSNDDKSYDFPEINCAQIPSDEETSTCSVVGHCVSEVKCPEGVRCNIDGKNITAEDNICGVLETYRCMVDCQRLNGTSCQSHVMCSSWTFRHQQTPTCPLDSDAHFGTARTDCATGDQTDTARTPSTTSMNPLTAPFVIIVLMFIAMIVWMSRKLVTNFVRYMRTTCCPSSSNADRRQGDQSLVIAAQTQGGQSPTNAAQTQGGQSPTKPAQTQGGQSQTNDAQTQGGQSPTNAAPTQSSVEGEQSTAKGKQLQVEAGHSLAMEGQSPAKKEEVKEEDEETSPMLQNGDASSLRTA